MRLKEYREFFQKMAGLLMLIDTFFLTTISGLAIYISEDGEDAFSNMLRTTFILGAFLIILSLIAGCLGFFSKSEGSSLVIRFSSVVNGLVGILYTITIIAMYVSKEEIRNDEYTRTIFIIALFSGILEVVFAIISFLANVKARSFSDLKNHFAKLVPDNMTLNRAKEVYYSISNMVSSLFALLTGLMAFYLARELDNYAKLSNKEALWQCIPMKILFVVDVVFVVALIVLSILSIVKPFKVKQLVLGVSAGSVVIVVALVIVIFSLIGSKPEKSGYTDITYIYFSAFLAVISLLTAFGGIKATLLSLKQH